MNITFGIRSIIIICAALIVTDAHAQYYILGRGLDDNEQPYAYATAELRGEGIFRQQTCSELGVFRFEDLPSGNYEIVLITAYGIRRKKVELRGSIDVTLHISRNIKISEINVIAKRAGATEPVTHTDINSEKLRENNAGQDMPYLLENTPSLVATSDAGHGIGYTGLRIRGTDPTRIQVTLNGIPVNDAESHNVFWVDLPDIVSSTTNIQIHRGIGWSQPGAGDLGAGIHLNTLGFQYDPYARVETSIGSFNTKRGMVQLGSGLIKGRFTIDGRGSYMQSDGFIDRAESKLYSAFANVGYHHDLSNIRFIYALGDELTYQAWNGVPEQYIDDAELRTFNSAGTEKSISEPHHNEVDDYHQSYYQFHFDQAITPYARWTTALHYTRGKGFFEQYKSDQDLNEYNLPGSEISDVIRQLWLDNHFYGFTSTMQIGSPLKRYLVLGGGRNTYEGDHYGEVIWAEESIVLHQPHRYYFNEAKKKDWNIFGRTNIKITDNFDATVDLQGRWIHYEFEGPDLNGMLTDQAVRHKFLNPKLGLRFEISEQSSLYALSGFINKEPNRDDYIHSTPASRPASERLWDNEVGYRYMASKLSLEVVGYFMDYDDQLLPTGRLNEVGAYTRVNVPESYRLGIETSFSMTPVERWNLEGSLTLSKNKIPEFQEYVDDWDTGLQQLVQHQNTDIAFSPGLIASLTSGYKIVSSSAHEISTKLTGKLLSKQFVDNTSNEGSLLDEYFVMDAALSWKWNTLWAKEFRLNLFLKNAFDHQYESNGWIYRFQTSSYDPVPDDPYAAREDGDTYHLKGFFPQAGRHFYASLSLLF